MLRCFWVFFFLFAFKLKAQTSNELERLNFFPRSKAFALLQYKFQHLKIDTPKQTANTTEVNNYTNSFIADYAYKLSPSYFVGVSLAYEMSVENSLRYGIPLEEKFTGRGYKESEFFLLSRLREQGKNHGLIDLYLSYIDAYGAREVGNDQSSQRYYGRNIFKIRLSHGMFEDDWEFRTSFLYTYYDEGEEYNKFTDQNYDIDSLKNFEFNFGAQYRLKERLYAYGSIGVAYRGTETITNRNLDKREIQAGTGSIFNLGLKQNLTQWTLIQIQGNYLRSEYFVKGVGTNLDGTSEVFEGSLALIQAF